MNKRATKRSKSSSSSSNSKSKSENGVSDGVTKFTNCRILLKGQLVKEDLWVQGGKVINAQKRFWDASVTGKAAHEPVVRNK